MNRSPASISATGIPCRVYVGLTAIRTIDLTSRFNDKVAVNKLSAGETMTALGLTEVARDRAKTLSGGMQRRFSSNRQAAGYAAVAMAMAVWVFSRRMRSTAA